MEIGSEFWGIPLLEKEEERADEGIRYVLSGRTALELAGHDLIRERRIRSVCLPAYCCDSMISPFLSLGLEVRFYDVQPVKGGLHRLLGENHGCDAVLLLDYFGFSEEETRYLAEREHVRGRAVILDRVQSLYSDSSAEEFSDYIVTSWRKWFFSCAGAAKKRTGEWKIGPEKAPLKEYVRLRREGAEKKAAWIRGAALKKQTFLDAFAGAEELLDRDFSGYEADARSVEDLRRLDISFLKRRRRENAQILYQGLSGLDSARIRPVFPEPGEGDVPLFVPILVRDSLRDSLRRFLIRNQVYCPVHWPDPDTGGGTELYAKELSLLCDQRYEREDMNRQIYVIKEYLNNYA